MRETLKGVSKGVVKRMSPSIELLGPHMQSSASSISCCCWRWTFQAGVVDHWKVLKGFCSWNSHCKEIFFQAEYPQLLGELCLWHGSVTLADPCFVETWVRLATSCTVARRVVWRNDQKMPEWNQPLRKWMESNEANGRDSCTRSSSDIHPTLCGTIGSDIGRRTATSFAFNKILCKIWMIFHVWHQLGGLQ